jgi:hypothetical protein
MKKMQVVGVRRWIAGIAVSICGVGFPLESAALTLFVAINAAPAGATSTLNRGLPPGIKVLAQLPLEGPLATGMYTQWEHGRTYLYVEQGNLKLTTVDITKRRNPKVVNHQPEPVCRTQNLIAAEGGPLERTAPNRAVAGVANVKDRGTLSVLRVDDPEDAQLLRLFGGSAPTRIETRPLDCKSDQGTLPGCKPIESCRELTVIDNDCDPFNFYWDSSRKSLAWWRN